jgi:hypothetical protein
MIGIAGYGFKNGKPNRLTYPYDPDNKACGLDAGYEESKYIYFPVPAFKLVGRSVCVKECPTLSAIATSPTNGDNLVGFKTNSKVTVDTTKKLDTTMLGHLFPNFDDGQLSTYEAANYVI